MATRLKEWMIPYTWWTGIEITDNHVINVLLRELNNLIHVNGDNELYVDLQLDDWILPDDDFPVGVTTGKILQADWWQQSWIILNWKTTSWDYVRFIYANDGKLYYDPWTWTWIEIWTWWGSVQINVATASTLWLIKLGSDTQQTESAVTATSISGRTYPVQLNADNQAVVNIPRTDTTYTAWANIVIDQNNVISTTIPQALVYKGSVSGLSDLPASWTVWDTYFVEWEDWMYSWDGTQWSYVWGTGIDVSDLFNKTTDDSDNIVQGTTNLFVTQAEKDRWNAKQDTLTEWNGIDITNNVVSNTLPFEPENTGGLGQFLKKTNSGYAWANVPSWWGTTYTEWDWIDITNNVISNTAKFDPTNSGTTGQVLKKGSGGSYYWATESWGEGNVKMFALASTSDTTTAQAILDWYNAGKLPIIKYNTTVTYVDVAWTTHTVTWDYTYYLEPLDNSNSLHFITIETANNGTVDNTNGRTVRQIPYIDIASSSGTVTTITPGVQTETRLDFIAPWVNYTNPYMPEYNGSPATKAYVDAVAAGSVQVQAITNNTTGTTLTLQQEWVGTQAQYDALTPINWVIYNIIPSS